MCEAFLLNTMQIAPGKKIKNNRNSKPGLKIATFYLKNTMNSNFKALWQ